MEIFWNTKISSDSKTDDPLGFLRRTKLRLFDTLFLGLTKPVYNAKYYSLYPAFIGFLEERGIKTRENLAKLDKAFLVAAKEISEKKKELGILGISSLSRLTNEDMYNLKFEMFENDALGFDKLRGNLIRMGLLKYAEEVGDLDTLDVCTTKAGKRFTRFTNLVRIKQLDNPKELINLLKEEVDLSQDEKEALRDIFLGRYAFSNKGEVEFLREYQRYEASKEALLKLVNGNLDDEISERNLLIKLRNRTILYWLFIYKRFGKLNKDLFIKRLLEDSLYNEDPKFRDIRELWRLYFIYCGYAEVGNLVMYYFYEILKKKWNNKNNEEVIASFEEIESVKSKRINYGTKKFTEIAFDIKENINKIDELPTRIKKLYEAVVEEYKKLDKVSKEILVSIDSRISYRYNIETFIEFFDEFKESDVDKFIFRFFRQFCLNRQEEVIEERGYSPKDERVLFYTTEKEISTKLYEDYHFIPVGVLDHSKLDNALLILSDLDLLQENRLSEMGERELNRYDY